MVNLPLIGGKVLLFDLEDVKKLRDIGICGILRGTLSAAPQQNVFLGLPLELMPEEVLWLVENEHGRLIDGSTYNKQPSNKKTWNDSHFINIKDSKQEAELIEKLRKNVKLSTTQLEERIENIRNKSNQKNFIVVPTVGPKAEGDYKNFAIDEYLSLLPDDIIQRYHVYRYLRDQGLYLLPGLRFGGQFLGYPNDPLRYHAHYIVNVDESCSLYHLIAGGRLATGVKKVWVLISEKGKSNQEKSSSPCSKTIVEYNRKPEFSCYSIEWAGFG